jgi:hypothetical protein
MAIEVYGASDDLIAIAGDIVEEVGCYGTDDRDKGVLLVFSDGTVAEVKYGKLDAGIWGIQVHIKGTAFVDLETCDDEDADRYSDTLRLGDGVKWVATASDDWNFTRAKKVARS